MVNVIGLGYIGLPTALMLASHGVEVVGTDYNPELVATLNAGKTTFEEKGLDELFAEAVKAAIADENAEMLIVAAATEADIAELEDYFNNYQHIKYTSLC